MTRLAPIFLGFLVLAAAGGFGACKRAQPEDPQAEAKYLYDAMCAKCHGADGKGGFPAAEGLPAPSNFRDPAFHADRTDQRLADAIRRGKGPMPPFGAMFDDVQTANLVRYIRSFNAKP